MVASAIANIMLSGGDIDAALKVVVTVMPSGDPRDQMQQVRERVQDGAASSKPF